MIHVVAALIWDENRLLICRRSKKKAQPLLWEFPGGKIEANETLEHSIIRECQEELNITVTPLSILGNTVYDYGDFVVNLTFMNVTIAAGEPQCLEHEEIRWVSVDQLDDFEFCPADVEILGRVKENRSKVFY